jgi:hypothetical protein
MAETYQVLAQLTPTALSLTTAYTVSTTAAVISSIIVCNTTGSDSTFRVSIQIGGASNAIQQYLYYDLPIANNDTFIATVGITLETTDVIAVQASSNDIAFNIFGTEIQ